MKKKKNGTTNLGKKALKNSTHIYQIGGRTTLKPNGNSEEWKKTGGGGR
jgi:hypothetical protein